ncbi:hypothetical protein [Streptosporangium sp. NPDC000396]|uniref:hypothetical protein n=1 Tax=Streptosporangium sp. NPDC000396 TaxID=3366185 RepID=UPI0036855FA5
MRRTTVAALAVLGSVVLTAGSGTAVAEPCATAREPIYVINFYGAEEGRADQRPSNLVVSEFSSLGGLTWRRWGPRTAVGVGKLRGSWCLPGCLAEPYTATVTLGRVKKVRGEKYFTRFDIDGDFPKPDEPADALSGALPTP